MSSAVEYQRVCSQVARAALACGRESGGIRVIAVSKTVGEAQVEEALRQGARDFGENRPELLAQKAEAFPQATWHMIGNIQSRKIPQIVAYASLIHSVCDFSHVQKIARAAQEADKVQDILVEVNVSGETSKSGLAPDVVKDFVRDAAGISHVRVCGLMTMAPIGDASVASDVFKGLAAIKDSVKAALDSQPLLAGSFCELSMGMTDDWPQAVAAGATIIRVGRAVFPPVEE